MGGKLSVICFDLSFPPFLAWYIFFVFAMQVNHYVSKWLPYYVIQSLGLVVGRQSNLMVIRATRRARGGAFVGRTRFCYNEDDQLVYVFCVDNNDPVFFRSKISITVEIIG